jgi:hypothetical protein
VILFRLAFLPFRLAFGVTGLTFKTGYRTGRLLGYRRLLFFGAGIGIGLLIAPTPGRELREKLRQRLQGMPLQPDDSQLADQVRFELTHSPRTWNLAQPEVEVTAGRVVLTGEVIDDDARIELERTASSVKGVTVVENQLAVKGTA